MTEQPTYQPMKAGTLIAQIKPASSNVRIPTLKEYQLFELDEDGNWIPVSSPNSHDGLCAHDAVCRYSSLYGETRKFRYIYPMSPVGEKEANFKVIDQHNHSSYFCVVNYQQ